MSMSTSTTITTSPSSVRRLAGPASSCRRGALSLSRSRSRSRPPASDPPSPPPPPTRPSPAQMSGRPRRSSWWSRSTSWCPWRTPAPRSPRTSTSSSGPRKDAMAYADWVRKDRRFSDILIQISPALSGHAFPRLKLRYKQSLVQLEGGSCHLPLVEPSMRASPLTPSEWREKLEARKRLETGAPGDTSEGRKLLLLDVRNDYEWDIGHFEGAKRPNVDCFRSTSFGLSNSEQEMDSTDPLHGVDKENTDILMYCTGGIRCDVYSTILREKGFGNLYTLKGGVSNYLKSQGSAEWVGNLFVFDDRLSLPPAKFAEAEAAAEEGGADNGDLSSSRWLGRCYVCGSEVEELRHRNCASIDCNRLYLCCGGCLEELRGCCCSECMGAPRLRRLLPGHQRYDKWHLYRDDASTISS
ncbi:rhodanese-like domain-containing protein 8, chloroplastic isoform X3 [Triticum dicoccoides]|uniref:rhodanese-like domain-containing protein 8, chloroplastic isoform X3 n=1 Tax=Triticum dicoccoides TaxID=85692 RepID=UPI0018918060|nr:rhodanese-like domain-containing protein 8, chloroplastic isoform X3 [Triticum dicoccoides]